ncbi:MAG: T9SS type A sorting domain-containing protein [Candidatus Cloacimonetes bacterium]|nr:T9SS type A sorting domain-containing protein [Candidatus Cloacimonadota bacterium]
MKKMNFLIGLIVALMFAGSMFAFSPDEILGLQIWLDANDLEGTLNDGDPVGTWYNKGEHVNDAVQGTEANRPIFYTDVGFPVVRFDGTNDFLNIDSDSALDMTAFSIIAVLKVNDVGSNIQVITSKEGTGANPWNDRNWWLSVNGNPATSGAPAHRLWFRTSSGGAQANGVNLYSQEAKADSQFFIAMVTFDTGVEATLFVDNNPDMTTTTVNTPDTGQPLIRIGSQGNIARFLNGDIAEFLIYDSALDGQDRDELYGYLYMKYFESAQPVELSAFTATVIANNYVQLSWTTETETNLLGYNVHRSRENDLSTAYKINLLLIDGAGNSSQQQIYTFIDEDVEMSTLYYYWLEAIDLDITTSFHGPISIQTWYGEDPETPPDTDYQTRLIGAYPNPFNPGTNIRFELDRPATINVLIYNILGQLVRSISESFEAGESTIYWDGQDNNGNPCQSGVFFYRFIASIGYQQYDKMILLK